MGTGITDIVGGPHDFLPPRSDRSDEFQKLCFGQFTSNFAQLLELIVLWSVYFLMKFRFFIPELWDFIYQIVGDFSYVAL